MGFPRSVISRVPCTVAAAAAPGTAAYSGSVSVLCPCEYSFLRLLTPVSLPSTNVSQRCSEAGMTVCSGRSGLCGSAAVVAADCHTGKRQH